MDQHAIAVKGAGDADVIHAIAQYHGAIALKEYSAFSTRTRILTMPSSPVHINRKLGQNMKISLAAPTSWRLGFLQNCSFFFLILVDGNLLVTIKIDTLVVLIYSFALFLIK